MRTLGGEVIRGRWGWSLSGGSFLSRSRLTALLYLCAVWLPAGPVTFSASMRDDAWDEFGSMAGRLNRPYNALAA